MSKRKTARGSERVLLIPDVHVPYHDPRAFNVVLAVAADWADRVVVLGDFADFAAVSTHRKDPRRAMPFAQEIDAVNEALDDLDVACRGKRKHYLEGNHETRLSRYLIDNADDLIDLLDWRGLLRLDRRRWEVTPYHESLLLGELLVSHDFGRAGINAARQAMLDVGTNAAFGHTHRLSVHYQGVIGGRRNVGATLGWLGDPLAIDYRHRNQVARDSVHGFGTVHLLPSGVFWLQAIPIIAGQAMVDGVIYGQPPAPARAGSAPRASRKPVRGSPRVAKK